MITRKRTQNREKKTEQEIITVHELLYTEMVKSAIIVDSPLYVTDTEYRLDYGVSVNQDFENRSELTWEEQSGKKVNDRTVFNPILLCTKKPQNPSGILLLSTRLNQGLVFKMLLLGEGSRIVVRSLLHDFKTNLLIPSYIYMYNV